MLKDVGGKDTPRSISDMFVEMLAVAEVKTRAQARQCEDASLRIQGTEEDEVGISLAESDLLKEILETLLKSQSVKRFVFSQLDNSIVE